MTTQKGTIRPFLLMMLVFGALAGLLYLAGLLEWALYMALSALWTGTISLAGFLVMKQAIVANRQTRFLALFMGSLMIDMLLGVGFAFYTIKVLQASKLVVAVSFFTAFFTFLYLKASGLVYLTNRYHVS